MNQLWGLLGILFCFSIFIQCENLFDQLNAEDCGCEGPECEVCPPATPDLPIPELPEIPDDQTPPPDPTEDPWTPDGFPVNIIFDVSGLIPFEFQTTRSLDLRIQFELFLNGETFLPQGRGVVSLRDEQDNLIFSGSTSDSGLIDTSLTLIAATSSLRLEVAYDDLVSGSFFIEGVDDLIRIDRTIYLNCLTLEQNCTDSDNDGICDGKDIEVNDNSLSFVHRHPPTGEYAVAFEDLFPNLGDADFNDSIMHYHMYEHRNSQNEVVKITGESRLVARGAGYNHRQFLAINTNSVYSGNIYGKVSYTDPDGVVEPDRVFIGNQRIDLELFTSTKGAFSDSGTQFNNVRVDLPPTRSGISTFEVVFSPPVSSEDLEPAPFDPYIWVTNTGYDVHLIGKSSRPGSSNPPTNFKDSNGYPWGLLIPISWRHPREQTSISDAFPKFDNWLATAGVEDQDWYWTFYPDKVY